MSAVGVVLRPQHPPEHLRDLVARVEDSGADELWLWEDCFLEDGATVAGMALAWTERVQVGIGVMPAPLRPVALAAMQVATLARAFPGRLVAAFGHGVLSWMGQAGVRVESPVTLLAEYLDAVRSLLTGDEVSVTGRYVTLDRVRLGWPPPVVPPVLVGTRGPRTLALAGARSDGVILDQGPSPGRVREALATAGGGAGFRCVVFLPVATGPDALRRLEAEARESGTAAPDPRAAGLAEGVAELVAELHGAGATSVALQPVHDVADTPAVVDLAADVRSRLGAAVTGPASTRS